MIDRDSDNLLSTTPSASQTLFETGQIGAHYLNLTGTEVAVDKTRVIGRASDPLPACWIPRSFEVVKAGPAGALNDVLQVTSRPGFDPRETTLVEASLGPDFAPGTSRTNPAAKVECSEGRIELQNAQPTVVVLRQQWLEGRSLVSESGVPHQLHPANGLHSAALFPPGDHRLTVAFETRGLLASKRASGAAWAFLIFGLIGLWASGVRPNSASRMERV